MNGIDVYLVVGRFECGNQKYVVVRDNRGACTLTEKSGRGFMGCSTLKDGRRKEK